MKNILWLVHEDEGQEARLQVALDLTRSLNGHLACLDVLPPPPALWVEDALATAMVLEREVADWTVNRTALQARLMKEDVSWSWCEATGDIADSLAEAASLADMVVLNRKFDAAFMPDMRTIAGAVALHAGVPVVAVPPEARRFDCAGRALIAWDGSNAVAATMRASIPLLKQALDVCLFTIMNGSAEDSVEDAAAYLSHHGIVPNIRAIHERHHAIDALIIEECTMIDAAYCVMGAYGHTQLAETLFGGVTHRMLASFNRPLILGH